MTLIKITFLIIMGFGSGIIISGGIFAFIAIIGVVPRMAQKTKTEKFIWIYEDCILAGGLFGALRMIYPFTIPIGIYSLGFFGLLTGIFIGCVAVSIAEVIDVIPILSRRAKLKSGLALLMVVLALGKLLGSLMFFFIPGFDK